MYVYIIVTVCVWQLTMANSLILLLTHSSKYSHSLNHSRLLTQGSINTIAR